MKAYRKTSWFDPRLERRESPISDFGVFAREPIRAGEIIFIWGGELLTDADLAAGRAMPKSVTNLAEGLYLGHLREDGYSLDDFLNHSCQPNTWLEDEVTVSTRFDIAADQELTIDYGLYLPSGWVTPWVCHCGVPGCRGRISGDDWMMPELRERYRGHFAPFVEEKIVRWLAENR